MKGLTATLGVLTLLAGTSAAAESFSGDKILLPVISGSTVQRYDDSGGDSRADALARMRDDGLPDHWFTPQVIVVEEPPKRRAPDPFARSHLLDGVQFRSDGDFGEQMADQYGGLGRSLSTSVFGKKHGESIRFKRVDDGLGISIDFD